MGPFGLAGTDHWERARKGRAVRLDKRCLSPEPQTPDSIAIWVNHSKARETGLDRLLITCDTDNVASVRVIEKNDGAIDISVLSLNSRDGHLSPKAETGARFPIVG
jgi:hypothetical protein